MTDNAPVRLDGFAGPLKTYPIPEALLLKAESWPTYQSTTDRRWVVQDEDGYQKVNVQADAPCTRCSECDDEIFPDDYQARLGHLCSHHGWRMNGKRYDGKNNVLEDPAR